LGLTPLRPVASRVFAGEEALEGSTALAGGHVALLSRRSPDGGGPNEDALALFAAGERSGVLAVADGLGGAPAGQLAAAVALEHLVTAVAAAIDDDKGLRAGILDGFERANAAVLGIGVGAGTTLTVVEIADGRVRPYHAGDSFVLITGQRGRVKLQTIPHSPVGYGVEAGLIDESAAMHHEERHIVSNAIGSPGMRIEVGSPLRLAPRDTLVMGSDGLSDNLRTEEIVACVRRGPLVTGANRLAQLAGERMRAPEADQPSKPDDLTFLVFRPGRGA
jgi:serine/threonine protein phosphatase PrpC